MVSEKVGSCQGYKTFAENYELIDLYGNIFYLFLDCSRHFPIDYFAEKINLLGGKMENGIIYARFRSQSQNEQSIEAQIRILQ